MLISLLTPTGARHECFALCEYWIKNQTIYNNPKYRIEWLCIDDYKKEPTKFTCGQVIVPAPMQWTADPLVNTQRGNMSALLERAQGDVIFIIEDDEMYAPKYLETMVKLLETADIAGISNDYYYHVGGGYKIINNWKHSSLCRTALRSSIKKLLYEAIHSGEYYIDIQLWTKVRDLHIPMNLIAHSKLSIGMKGLKGRSGLGAGHALVGYVNDKDLSKLKEWLGNDWIQYKNFIK